MPLPLRFHLSRPESFLGLFARGTPPRVELGEVDVAEAWALVGLSVLARRSGSPPLEVGFDSSRPASQFAYALGLQDVIEGRPSTTLGERGRTARLRRVRKIGEVESAAREIAELLVPSSEDDDSRATTFYVLVELLRNAVQHSGDPNGGVVAAQLMREGYAAYPRPVVQVAVGDAGVGLPAALQVEYPEVTDPEAAVVKALEPHVSGAFRRGLTGSTYNAGMGLFMISEMAKLTAGRFLLATRGATLWLRGNLEDVSNHQMDLLPRLGFPGTLVAFELPFGEPADHDGLVSVITQRASERTPSRDTSVWVRFEAPPPGTDSFLVSAVIEDVERAHELSRTSLQPLLFARKPIALDFRNMRVCTQSFLHALLFEAIRLSWATQTPIYVEQASPGVETGIRLVDNYARGG